MAINFSNITLEIIDININSTPDIFVNGNGVTFSKRVLEDMGYPQNVQYCVDAAQRILAVRACKSNEAKATPFSKPRSEQTSTLSTGNRTVREIAAQLIPNYNPQKRYKITGEYDSGNKVMYFDMNAAAEAAFHAIK